VKSKLTLWTLSLVYRLVLLPVKTAETVFWFFSQKNSTLDALQHALYISAACCLRRANHVLQAYLYLQAVRANSVRVPRKLGKCLQHLSWTSQRFLVGLRDMSVWLLPVTLDSQDTGLVMFGVENQIRPGQLQRLRSSTCSAEQVTASYRGEASSMANMLRARRHGWNLRYFCGLEEVLRMRGQSLGSGKASHLCPGLPQ
jgi:hypothetical protein